MSSEDQGQEQVDSMSHRKPVLPGPFPPRRVPPPIEAVCVQVTKIYDACSQKRCAEVKFPRKGTLPAIPKKIVECTTSDFEADCSLTSIQDDPPLVRVNVEYKYIVTVTFEGEDGAEYSVRRRVRHDKSVVLFGTEEMFCKVEAVLECLGCDILGPDKIFCEVGEFIVIKSALDVQLLIPAYGFCPPPPECEELPTRCEEFLEAPPPRLFPPQPWELGLED